MEYEYNESSSINSKPEGKGWILKLVYDYYDYSTIDVYQIYPIFVWERITTNESA